ncbi:MAG: GNAT family N-acetyltransferase [Pseudomonadota bacterium]
MNQHRFLVHSSGQLPDNFIFPEAQEGKFHYLQTADWYDKHTSNHFVTASFDGEHLVARSIVHKKSLPMRLGNIFRVERGPAAVSDTALCDHIDHLCDFLKKDGVLIEISPYSESEQTIEKLDGYLLDKKWKKIEATRYFYKNTIVIDLERTEQEIRSSIRKSFRNLLNRAGRSDMTFEIRPDRSKVDALIAQYNVMAAKRGLLAIDSAAADYIHHGTDVGKVIVCVISLDGTQLGGNIMLSYQDRLAAEWGVYSDRGEHRKIPMAHFADWESLMWAKAQGYKKYDLCGYWLEQGDENSINLYKSGFSKNIVSITPEYDYHLKPFAAQSLDAAKALYSRLKKPAA